MKKINIKTIIIFLMLLLPIIVLITTTTKNFISNSNKIEKQADDAIELDNWEISTVFYDSTVDNGLTPLTEINWDATDDGYKQGSTRIITVQINYKNTNSITTYQPGELEIKIPNLFFGAGSNNKWTFDDIYSNEEGRNSQLFVTSLNVGANDYSHTGYDWTFAKHSYKLYEERSNGEISNSSITYSDPSVEVPFFYFKNANKIDERSNFEGNIKIVYEVYPKAETPERGENDCTHTLNKSIYVTLANQIESEHIEFNYSRIYNHPYIKVTADLTKYISNVTTYDLLGENPQDYYWVKFRFHSDDEYKPGKIVYATKSRRTIDYFPTDCVVYDRNFNKLEPNSEGAYEVYTVHSGYFTNTSQYLGYGNTDDWYYVGYPKSIYNTQNNNLEQSNTAYLYGIYSDEEGEEFLSSSTVNFNLQEYDVSLGTLESMEKNTRSYDLRYQDIINKWSHNYVNFSLNPHVLYNGKPMTIVFGDDLLYYQNDGEEIKRLGDNDYYIKTLSTLNDLRNGHLFQIERGKYDCELWLRKAGNSEYFLYRSFKNGETTNTGLTSIGFTEDDEVVGYYYVIKDMNESLITKWQTGVVDFRPVYSYSGTYNSIVLKKNDIKQTGKIYNYGYFKVYEKINDELVLRSSASASDYDSILTNDNIPEMDISKYGSYLNRRLATAEWKYYVPQQEKFSVNAYKYNSNSVQNEAKQQFEGVITLGAEINAVGAITNTALEINYIDSYDTSYKISGFYVYDLLPSGVNIESTVEEIINSASIGHPRGRSDLAFSMKYYKLDGTFLSNNDLKTLMLNNTTVDIKENWKNTGRTKITIFCDLKDNPIYAFGGEGHPKHFKYSFNYSISYDSAIENGLVYDNYLYADGLERDIHLYESVDGMIEDNGVKESEAMDINENGVTNDLISFYKDTITIKSVSSSHQDVQTSVQTDMSNFDTGKVNTSNESEYKYKLRARTGSADVTNLVIYDSLEDYAKNPDLEIVKAAGLRHYWQGEFLGVDTSYAESKGYTVKVYYNENALPGTLKDDSGWKVYSDSVDKTKVKSLAFEYLNADGTAPAVLPANSLSYVLINMKSPIEEYKTFAYNGCWTEWNAIDPITERPVDFITGINSNIVKVALPSSVELEDINLTLTKVWSDNNNSKNIRPANVKYKLITNDDYQNATEVTLSGTGNTWTTTITVPKYDDDGEIIHYTISEDTINLENGYKYIPVVDNTTITNTLYKTITITKNWKDNTNAYLTRPTNVTVIVYQNGNYYKDLIVSGNYSTNTWTGSLTVPVFDNNGTEYTYTVDEVAVDNYQTTCNNLTCTNTLTGNKNITVKKEWKDNNNAYQTRPSSINIYLKQNGNSYKTVSLTGNGNTWESDSITVPMYDNNGVKYTYTIDETQLAAYGLVTYDQNNLKVTNTLKQNNTITITKNWYDNNNAYQTRPQSLRVKVLQNNSDYQTVTLTGTGNTWTTDLDVPKYDDNQQAYVYKIQEIDTDIKDEYTDVTYATNSLTVTNKLKKNITLTVKKVWIDNDNELGLRPNSLQLTILQNGSDYKTITLSGDSSTWTQDIEVPKYDENQKEYKYTIKEINDDSLSEYANVSYSTDDLTVTNTLSSNIILTITKIWVDNDNELGLRPNELTITLLQNGNDYKTITLSGDSSTWTQEIEVPKYDDNQHEYTYTIKEITDNVNSDYSDITYSETDLSVTNKLKKNNDLTITKVWIDDNNKHLTRPDFIEVQVYQNGKEYKKVKLSSDSNWKSTIKDVPIYDNNGAKYTYTIKEPKATEYYDKVTIDQTTLTITNELTEEPKVNLYFTVVNGYTEPGSDEIKYDEDGLHDVLRKYNIDPDQEYLFEFKLENIETEEVYDGKLSSKGVLEFKEIPYGSYRAIEGEDEFFDFVSMLEIEKVLGIEIIPEKNGGIITIKPTGKTTTYGINIVNKIPIPIQHIEQQEENPNTLTSIIKITIVSLIVIISLIFVLQSYKKYSFLKA